MSNNTRKNGVTTPKSTVRAAKPVSGSVPKRKPVQAKTKHLPLAKSSTQVHVKVPVKKASTPRKSKKGSLPGHLISALILENLSLDFSDVCNYAPEVELARKGHVWLALESIKDKNARIVDSSARVVWVKAQAEASLKKLVDPSYDRWPDTKAAWFSDEHSCKRTNQKLDAYMGRHKRANTSKELPHLRLVQRARSFIEYVIGSDVDLNEAMAHGRHGPGSTTDVRGSAVHYLRKSQSLSCTPLAMDLAALSLSYDKGMWESLGFDPSYSHLESAREGFIRAAKVAIAEHVIDYDRLLFVHKSATALRSIGSQPTLNVLGQLGIDSYLKDRLRKYANIDLSDQSVNQRLAFEGSRDHLAVDPWATLDKSSASNLIAKNLILLLFPAPWCRVLMRLRSPRYLAPTELGGGIHSYEMYAGMGNGTTFAVESLIFAAFCYAVGSLEDPSLVADKRTFSVYGDDVIIRSSEAKPYIQFAEYMGLRMNYEKSFLEGPFRESCGADYWNGTPVRPAYVNCDTVDLHPLEVIGVHNTLMDSRLFKLPAACRGIRDLFKRYIHEKLPTDPSGGLGFRPDHFGGYSLVRDALGNARVSPAWQRPLYFMYTVRPKLDKVEEVTPWLALMGALQGGSVVSAALGGTTLALPFRKLTNVNLQAERDLHRSDLCLMLANQLSRLACRKTEPWYQESRGLVDDHM
nr:MAG: RNA-dependent RNA polymerase [Riboviria sp.]